MTEKAGKIFGQMPKVMEEVGAIAKERKNQQQGYAFRGIDDAYNAIQPAFIKNKVFCVPEVLSKEREERKTNAGKAMFCTILTVKFTFFADDGSSVFCITVGEAMDMADKSCNKAMSAAQKYAFFQSLCIATEETDDADASHPETVPKENGKQPAGRTSEPQRKSANASTAPEGKKREGMATQSQIKMIFAKLKRADILEEDFKSYMGIESMNDLKIEFVNEALKSIDEGKIKKQGA